tara:strand:+ start:767 stop:1867 length:1101 start_codon:yes stop_codon:yes gene_type:complete
MIPITRVAIDDAIKAEVLSVLDSGMIAQGPKVVEFEERCSEMAGTRAAVAVNSGTAALLLALRSFGIGPGDEVITSPLTFAATLNAILETGATARFGDIGDDFNLDMGTVEPLLSKRTRALLPVHLYGGTADMASATNICERHNLALVEDAAQAHFATTPSGQAAGSFGLGCFSFYATKNLMCGEGGVVTVDDPDLEQRMRTLRNQGMERRYDYEMPGHNLRLTDLAAAVAIPQFDHVEAMLAARRKNAAALGKGLEGLPGLVTPNAAADAGHVWHQYTIRLTQESPIHRDALAESLAEHGVGHGFYYPKAVYDYDCYRTHPRVRIDGSPRAEAVAASVISLPVHHHLEASEVDHIIDVVRSALGA